MTITQPFPVGARIFDLYRGVSATVIEHTERGFKYALDKPFFMGSRFGYTTGGELYEAGFDSWELWTGTNKVREAICEYEDKGICEIKAPDGSVVLSRENLLRQKEKDMIISK